MTENDSRSTRTTRATSRGRRHRAPGLFNSGHSTMGKVLDVVARCTAPKELPDDILGTRDRTQAFARARVAQK